MTTPWREARSGNCCSVSFGYSDMSPLFFFLGRGLGLGGGFSSPGSVGSLIAVERSGRFAGLKDFSPSGSWPGSIRRVTTFGWPDRQWTIGLRIHNHMGWNAPM